ncbi:TasA family protein [Paucisalibacillus sp. EB02]|uniref:TasA family protein n=1 Tax=Paucisalibacillus sp. EB02 TaxID=1347087 RepID=UPI0004B9B322|nr:TasA family protein [Paucisalibacillus sp. EB02]
MKRILLIIVFGALFSIMFSPILSFADDSVDSNEKYNIDLSLTPGEVLFNIENMKPGDWAPRDIVVKNNGKLDFEYQMHIKNEGDDKLYNELLLEIKDAKTTLYSGKLADIDKLSPRFLKVDDSEELQFTIRFPEHLGNEFQGLSVNFQLQFVAEKSSAPTEPENPEDPEDPEDPNNPEDDKEQPGGSKDDSGKGGKKKDVESVSGVVNNNNSGGQLPDTATNMFNFIIIGVNLLLVGGLIWMISIKRKSKVRRV